RSTVTLGYGWNSSPTVYVSSPRIRLALGVKVDLTLVVSVLFGPGTVGFSARSAGLKTAATRGKSCGPEGPHLQLRRRSWLPRSGRATSPSDLSQFRFACFPRRGASASA